ncbi:MAG: pyridoxal-phosphate dependent enzyme [Acidobacteriaceae bacterium]
MTSTTLPSLLTARPATQRPHAAMPESMWRFLASPTPVSLGEGNTPLLPVTNSISLKDEGRNPGASMLDRIASILVTIAKATGHKHLIFAVESDTLAASLAVYSAIAGLPCSITLTAEASDLDYLRATTAGAALLTPSPHTPVEATLSPEDITLATHLATHTIACEIAEQLQWKFPETVLVPGATPADLLHFEQSFAFLLQHNWTTSTHAPRCLAVHIAPAPHTRSHAPARIAAQALQQLSDQVIVLEEDRVREALQRMARAGWMLSPGAAAGIAAAETLPASAAPIVLLEPRSALSAAREIAQILGIRRYPTRMPVGGIISPL